MNINKRSHKAAVVATGVGILLILVLLLNLALFGLAVWAVVFGIIDLVNHGPNFWNIFWMAVGGIYILSRTMFTVSRD